MEAPLLFISSRAALPTAREVAEQARTGGAAALGAGALGEVTGRGHYREIRCRSVLNRVEGMPFRWTVNPYRGCTHGCHYCFARRYHRYFELNPGDDFSGLILVKTNAVEVLRQELDRPSWKRELVAVGTATDPYQPIEGKYRLTRGCLQVLALAATPVGLVTKGPLVVRDADVLVELARRARCTVYFSVPVVDHAIWSSLEPGTAPPMQRLRAMSRLIAAGVRAGVLLAPIVPGITTARHVLEETVRAAAEHGACFMGANLLHLEGGTREHFLAFLAEHYPHLRARYDRLYPTKYARKSYADQIYTVVEELKDRYRLAARREDAPKLEPAADSGPTDSQLPLFGTG